LTVDQADGLRHIVSVPVVEPTEVVTLVCRGDTLVAARNRVGAVDDARIQDIEYKDIVVDSDDVDVHGSVGQLRAKVRQATIHPPGARRQTCATVSC